MVSLPKRRDFIKAGAAAGFAALAVTSGSAREFPARPERGRIRMGIGPWLGYGLWHIAAKKGLFMAQGLDSVEIVSFTTDADRNAALAEGELECCNAPTYAALDFVAAGLPLKIVALLDMSKTADAIISDGSVTDIKGIKGKQVAFEE